MAEGGAVSSETEKMRCLQQEVNSTDAQNVRAQADSECEDSECEDTSGFRM